MSYDSALDVVFENLLRDLETMCKFPSREPTVKLAYLFLRGLRLAGVKPSQLLYDPARIKPVYIDTDTIRAAAFGVIDGEYVSPVTGKMYDIPSAALDTILPRAYQVENPAAEDKSTAPLSDYVVQPGQTVSNGSFMVQNYDTFRLHIRAEPIPQAPSPKSKEISELEATCRHAWGYNGNSLLGVHLKCVYCGEEKVQ